jgi:RND family efflux transporter MFP subunit
MTKRIAALAAGCVALLSAAALAQGGGAQQAPPDGIQGFEPLLLKVSVLTGPRLSWVEKSDVAAIREGVVEHMELKIGMQVKKDGTIGYLHREVADCTVKKAQLQAEAKAPKAKAEAQKEVAISVVARNNRLNQRIPGAVSAEDAAKAEGELKVAEASILEAIEQTKIAVAELGLAKQTFDDHEIKAPFEGIVINRYKNPGEGVRAGDKIVMLGNPYKLCVDAYVPLEYVDRVKVGQIVEVQQTKSYREPLVFENKKYQGKIVFVSPEVQTVGETGARVRAEFNNPDLELRPGFLARLTIFLPPAATANAAGDKDATTRTARSE